MEGIGHNSGEVSKDRLKSFISRIEKIEGEREALSDDLKDIYAEAKGTGFDAPTIKKLIQTRKKIRKNSEKYKEQLELFDIYAGAIGMDV